MSRILASGTCSYASCFKSLALRFIGSLTNSFNSFGLAKRARCLMMINSAFWSICSNCVVIFAATFSALASYFLSLFC